MNAPIGAMLAALAIAVTFQAASAQDARKPPANPVGIAPTWNQSVTRDVGVVGEQLDMLALAIRIEALDRLDNSNVQDMAPFL